MKDTMRLMMFLFFFLSTYPVRLKSNYLNKQFYEILEMLLQFNTKSLTLIVVISCSIKRG